MNKKYDAIIVGAGYLGLISAIALGSRDMNVIVLERKSKASKPSANNEPCRLFAISEGSLRVINSLCGLDISSLGQSINGIRVQEFSNGSFLEFDPHQLHMKNFGIMIEEDTMMSALQKKATEYKSISYLYDVTINDVSSNDDDAEIHTNFGTISAPITLVCDGKFSEVRDLLGIETMLKRYHQHGVICDVGHSKNHHGIAIENFTAQGPFAILPKLGGHESSIVWTLESELATGLKKLSKDQITHLIEERMSGVLGDIELKSEVRSYPLDLKYANSYSSGRFYLLGDALHAIHPLAGQGLNLSIRDADFIINSIIKSASLGLDIGMNGLLTEYFKNRNTDNQMMIESTDLLNKLFSNNNVFLRLFRSVGLDAVEQMPGLKRLFILYACGLF